MDDRPVPRDLADGDTIRALVELRMQLQATETAATTWSTTIAGRTMLITPPDPVSAGVSPPDAEATAPGKRSQQGAAAETAARGIQHDHPRASRYCARRVRG